MLCVRYSVCEDFAPSSASARAAARNDTAIAIRRGQGSASACSLCASLMFSFAVSTGSTIALILPNRLAPCLAPCLAQIGRAGQGNQVVTLATPRPDSVKRHHGIPDHGNTPDRTGLHRRSAERLRRYQSNADL